MAKRKRKENAGEAAAREESLAVLVEEHGIGCPRAVQLGGPGVVDNWINEQHDNIAKAADAGAADDVEDEVATEAELEAREAADAEAREGAEVTTGMEARAGQPSPEASGVLFTELFERIGEVEDRLEAQESQGTDQWAAIEANTAGRIALTRAVEKRKRPRRPSDGKPKGKK